MTARARRQARELAAECRALEVMERPAGWLLMTLTTPNVRGDELKAEVKRQLQAWRDMARKARIKRASVGWARRLEITFNAAKKTHHAHIHAMLAVREGYYDPSKGLYITQKDLQKMWAEELGIDLDKSPLIVDIRAIEDTENAAKETAKYITKIADYEADDSALAALAAAVHGRNLMQYGGALRRIRRELGHTAREDEVLQEDANENVCPVCGTALEYAVYQWMGIKAEYKRL